MISTSEINSMELEMLIRKIQFRKGLSRENRVKVICSIICNKKDFNALDLSRLDIIHINEWKVYHLYTNTGCDFIQKSN